MTNGSVGKPNAALRYVSDHPRNTPARGFPRGAATTYIFLISVNITVWIWATFALGGRPTLWGLATLAYIFGLPHAFDADHIAAIDDVVRKLIQQGKSASSVGLLFSLGYSTVVVLACAAIAIAAAPLQHRLETLHDIGGILGTAVPALFLLLIGLVNLFVLRNVWVTFPRVRLGERIVAESLHESLLSAGTLARLYQPLLRLVSRSWHMYPVGLLFDIATEIGLPSISAQSTVHRLHPYWCSPRSSRPRYRSWIRRTAC